MPTGGILLIIAAGAGLYFTGSEVVKVAKKVGHAAKHVVVRVVKCKPRKG